MIVWPSLHCRYYSYAFMLWLRCGRSIRLNLLTDTAGLVSSWNRNHQQVAIQKFVFCLTNDWRLSCNPLTVKFHSGPRINVIVWITEISRQIVAAHT